MTLTGFFTDRAARRQPLVLVTVVETRGSTYSKSGDQMLIDSGGNFRGMLSGGCLEGDLVERARSVIASGAAQTVDYDLGADDELWGMGVGCDGSMRLLLQSLSPDDGYQPFAAMAAVLDGGVPAVAAVVVEGGDILPGAALLMRDDEIVRFGIDSRSAQQIAGAFGGDTGIVPVETGSGRCRVLFIRCTPAPALLILGAGLDSEPVARFACELGWRCTVVDHRPAYLEERRFPSSVTALSSAASELSAAVRLSDFDMAVVMSHHLASDRAYLEQLAGSSVGYIGLLGPSGRRDRLLRELSPVADQLRGRLHGPAGVKLGGRGPGPIALEIVAGLQRFLAERDEV